MRQVTVAATQFACDWDIPGNIARAERLAREAASQGAQVILIQELFEAPYFCKDQDERHFALARPFRGNETIARFSALRTSSWKSTPGERWSWATITRCAPLMMNSPPPIMIGMSPR